METILSSIFIILVVVIFAFIMRKGGGFSG